MTPVDFSPEELTEFKDDLEATFQACGLSYEKLGVEVDASQDLLKITMRLCSDSVVGPLNPTRCKVEFFAKLPCLGINIEGGVIFGGFVHSIPRGSSHFFPVPEEYGDWVSLSVDWEFNPETLYCGYGSVRDRGSLHHVNIQPSDDLRGFIGGLSSTARKWGISYGFSD
jgi:hypothetical protein